jgi:hypothetical protein
MESISLLPGRNCKHPFHAPRVECPLMNTRTRHLKRGGVLVTMLMVCMLIGIMLTAYLAMISKQQTFTFRSQVWNHCIPMCEAGVEEALAHINYIDTTTNFAINGWSVDAAGSYRKERELNYGTCWIAIDTNMPPVITAVGGLRLPLQTAYVTRAVRVRTKFNQQFPNAILARGAIAMNGSARLDSFNSTNAQESTGGQYDPAKFTDHASVATVSQQPGQLNIGNVSIYGSVATGPGGDITLQANGNVGSTAFNNNSLYDGLVQEGHVTDDVNVMINEAGLPETWGQPVPPAKDTIGGTNYTYVLRQGDYQLSGNLNLTGGNDRMIVVGKARLYVTGTTTVGGPAYILIGTGGSVEWYAGGDVDLGGGGVLNSPGFAKNFSVIGLQNCTSVTYDGHSAFVGTIYAPDADVKFTGTSDIFGAVVGKTITVQGHVQFHYDEALRGNPKFGRFIAYSWEELKPEEYAAFIGK